MNTEDLYIAIGNLEDDIAEADDKIEARNRRIAELKEEVTRYFDMSERQRTTITDMLAAAGPHMETIRQLKQRLKDTDGLLSKVRIEKNDLNRKQKVELAGAWETVSNLTHAIGNKNNSLWGQKQTIKDMRIEAEHTTRRYAEDLAIANRESDRMRKLAHRRFDVVNEQSREINKLKKHIASLPQLEPELGPDDFTDIEFLPKHVHDLNHEDRVSLLLGLMECHQSGKMVCLEMVVPRTRTGTVVPPIVYIEEDHIDTEKEREMGANYRPAHDFINELVIAMAHSHK